MSCAFRFLGKRKLKKKRRGNVTELVGDSQSEARDVDSLEQTGDHMGLDPRMVT